MELWINTLNKVYLEDVPDVASTPSATWKKDGNDMGALPTATETAGDAWSTTIPYLQSECTVEVTWTFTVVGSGSFTRTDSYEVITPILTRRQIKAVWSTATDQQILDIESAVRQQIQAYTGQTFGKRVKTEIVLGNGEDALALPEKLDSLTGVATLTETLNPEAGILVGDGWYLKMAFAEPLQALQTDNLYFSGYKYSEYGIVIEAPPLQRDLFFRNDYPFAITGTWGYPAVPQAVQEAAKLLVNDYACSEQAYRDRYLDSIKSADWRLQFKDGAYRRTGNVRADQLLDDYVVFKWAVI